MQNVYLGKECISVEDSAFSEFAENYNQIEAGGGLVRNEKGEYLLIFRHDVWDLPKGKQEPDETIEECALREVEEETGLKGLELGSLICTTHHTYRLFGESCLKNTWWYNMNIQGCQNTVPQAEEDISKAEWVKPEELAERLATTYPSIREVFASAGLL